MFGWIKALLGISPPAQPTPQPSSEVYRFHTAKPGTRPNVIPSKTLFEKPAAVPVVPPTTEADAYKWLEYGGAAASVSALPTESSKPKKTDLAYPVDPSGNAGTPVKPAATRAASGSLANYISGICLYVTGRSEWPRWGVYTTTGCPGPSEDIEDDNDD